MLWCGMMYIYTQKPTQARVAILYDSKENNVNNCEKLALCSQ